MKRTIAEKKVLKKLGIPDFRHMTKEKIMKFASMLPYMDSEVAKKALEQFPEFRGLAVDLVKELGKIVDKSFDKNEKSQNVFYEACNSVLLSLQVELEKEGISPEERNRIEDKMIELVRMIGEKDTENKKFIAQIIATVGTAAAAVLLAAVALLGGDEQMTLGTRNEEEDDDYVEL